MDKHYSQWTKAEYLHAEESEKNAYDAWYNNQEHDAVVDTLPEPQVEYLKEMLKRNVLWWSIKDEWDVMFQNEILNRGLVIIDGDEHKALLELLEREKDA